MHFLIHYIVSEKLHNVLFFKHKIAVHVIFIQLTPRSVLSCPHCGLGESNPKDLASTAELC